MKQRIMAASAAVALLFLVNTSKASTVSKAKLFEEYHRLRQTPGYQALGDFTEVNQEPVIGVVSQTLEDEMKGDSRFDDYHSYVMQSYVDWLEAAGARVVPLNRDEDHDVTLKKLKRLNGVLMPGGEGNYHDYGRYIFDRVKEINDNGTYLPIWGTCAGQHELLSYVADAGWDVLGVYEMDSASLPLDFAYGDPSEFLMFQGLGPDAWLLTEYNVTYNSHHWSLDPAKFSTDQGLGSFFKPTSLSYMPDGRPFVASMETTGENARYPFYGTQFHPEKAARIYNPTQAVNHGWESVLLNQYFAEFFVQECRKSANKYGNYSET
jgi:gamma-glutamyl hydrolase